MGSRRGGRGGAPIDYVVGSTAGGFGEGATLKGNSRSRKILYTGRAVVRAVHTYMGLSIYYVIQIWGPGQPLPPYCNIVINWEDPLPPM